MKFSLDNKGFLELFDFILFTKLKMATCTLKDGSLLKERFKAGALSKFEYFQLINSVQCKYPLVRYLSTITLDGCSISPSHREDQTINAHPKKFPWNSFF